MADLNKRIDRIEARIGADANGFRTLAEIIRWTTEREQANGGTLSTADRLKSSFYFRRLFEEAAAREARGEWSPVPPAKSARRRL